MYFIQNTADYIVQLVVSYLDRKQKLATVVISHTSCGKHFHVVILEFFISCAGWF